MPTVVAPSAVSVAFTGGTDGDSGIGNRQLQRDESNFVAGACAAFPGTWTNIGPVNPTSPYADSTGVTGKCYRYRLLELDRVSNQMLYTSGNEVRVDGDNPSGTISLLPAGPWSGSVPLTGTASDVGSGVDHVELTYTGPSSGTICSIR